jgi:hypothetical protein
MINTRTCWPLGGYLLSALLLSVGCKGQDVRINEPPRLSAMIDSWINHNRQKPDLTGWRVQLISSTDRTQVENGKELFQRKYPDVPVDWVHERPYYKLRAGAFHTRLEAYALVDELRTAYPGAYPAKDNKIHPRDFIRP